MGAPTPPREGACAEATVGLTARTAASVAHIAPVLPPDASRLAQVGLYLAAAGPRAVAEFLAELARTLGCGTAILAQADAWRAIMPPTRPALVLNHYAGARQFPPHLSEVPS